MDKGHTQNLNDFAAKNDEVMPNKVQTDDKRWIKKQKGTSACVF